MKENFLLINIDWSNKNHEELTLNTAAKFLGVSVESIDKEFGIVNVDVGNNIYTLQIKEADWNRLNNSNKNVKGPFSNVRIEPFGLDLF